MRMNCAGRLASVVGLVLVLVVNGTAAASDSVKHSGSIVSIGRDSTFVLAEVGPWSTRNGATVITHRTITLVDDTRYALARREEDSGAGFPGGFVEYSVGPEHVYLDDYVTVECRHEGARLVAVKITAILLRP